MLRQHIAILCLSAVLAALQTRAAWSDLTLETRHLRLTVSDTGVCRSLIAKATQKEYATIENPGPAFSVVQSGRSFPVSSAALVGDTLTVKFAGANATAKMSVIRADDYVALKLNSLSGGAVDAINLLQLRIKPLPYLGPWIDVAYDDEFGICLCGGNVRTNAGLSRAAKPDGPVELKTSAYRVPGFDGATAVLFGVPDPKNKFPDTMAIVERDFDMPPGAANRRSPMQRYSYLWASPTPGDIDEYIKIAKRAGFRMILYSYTNFARSAGHFEWNPKYPNGMSDLKKVADSVRNAGLALGLHIHYSKAHKTDSYVTPVPDERLGKIARLSLASAIDEKTSTITVNEHPRECTLDEGRRILKAGKELIQYQTYTTIPPYQFLGCERGALKTKASRHASDEEIAALDVDTWPIFIRFDQAGDIQDEAARRLADIIKETGPYDMVYFDGAEDVPSPFWFHCANAAWRVFGLLKPTPPVCEAAANTHFSWHMMTRSNAYDSVAPSEMKDFCRKNPCQWAPRRALDFTRIEFGWLHGFGRSPKDYIAPDTLEYVISRAAAWDCPFSLSLRLPEVKTNPRTESCFDVVKIWEDARIGQKLTDAQREQLKNLDQEHHLFINEKGSYELASMVEITPADRKDLFRAYTFHRAKDTTTYVLIWAVGKDVELTLPVGSDRITAMRPFGKQLIVPIRNGKTVIAVGERMYLAVKEADPTTAEQILRNCSASPVKP
jgi:hypothetical protein